MTWTLRIARPSSNPEALAALYVAGLGFQRLGGHRPRRLRWVMVGPPGATYHFEFTLCRHHPVQPSPTEEDLLVFSETDRDRWPASNARETSSRSAKLNARGDRGRVDGLIPPVPAKIPRTDE